MTPEQIQLITNKIDNNLYEVVIKDPWKDLELSFTAQVNMPYSYWMEMSTFWMGHKEDLEDANNNVIKRVLLLYGKRIIEYVLAYPYASLNGINQHLETLEGYCHGDEFKVTQFNFDFDYDLEIKYKQINKDANGRSK